MVWLIIGGPLAVVIAGLITAAIAAAGADDVLSDEEKRAASGVSPAQRPALEGRNHAAMPKPADR
ncbi:MAG TPA: hypothetical protein PLB26_07880 [Rubrivivax sp.]|nr:hypothetical protein [Rubrivivax sp.]